MKITNKAGMTLVEMIIGIALLSIAGMMLATCFGSTTKIVNQATLYKNESSAGAAAIELQSEEDGAVFSGKTDKVVFEINNKSYTAQGELVSYSSDKTGLHYSEFLTGAFHEFEE